MKELIHSVIKGNDDDPFWGEDWDEPDPTMLAQLEIEEKIETFRMIDQEIANGIKPF